MVQPFLGRDQDDNHFVLKRSLAVVASAVLAASCSGGRAITSDAEGANAPIRVPPVETDAASAPSVYAGVQPYVEVPPGLDCPALASYLAAHLDSAVESVNAGEVPEGLRGWYRLKDGSFVAGGLAQDDLMGGFSFLITAYAFSVVFDDARSGGLESGCAAEVGFFAMLVGGLPPARLAQRENDPSLASTNGGVEGLLVAVAEQMLIYAGVQA